MAFARTLCTAVLFCTRHYFRPARLIPACVGFCGIGASIDPILGLDSMRKSTFISLTCALIFAMP